MILKTIVVTHFGTNCYLVGCAETRRGAVLDPGGDAPAILAAIRESGLTIQHVINTHGHIDHSGANRAVLEATGATLLAHRLEAALLADPQRNLGLLMGQSSPGSAPDRLLEEGDIVEIGALRWEVRHTPGHTPGGISLYCAAEAAAFTGDTLFRAGIGRADLPGGHLPTLMASIATKLLTLPDATTIYPGHGPASTIAYEKRHNPWLQRGV